MPYQWDIAMGSLVGLRLIDTSVSIPFFKKIQFSSENFAYLYDT